MYKAFEFSLNKYSSGYIGENEEGQKKTVEQPVVGSKRSLSKHLLYRLGLGDCRGNGEVVLMACMCAQEAKKNVKGST